LWRVILIEPTLYLCFNNKTDAKFAAEQNICLCRNEDILWPDNEICSVSETEFDDHEGLYKGFELMFEESNRSFIVGYNRFEQNRPMYGWIKIIGHNPLKSKLV
jgi:hypothetical protein